MYFKGTEYTSVIAVVTIRNISESSFCDTRVSSFSQQANTAWPPSNVRFKLVLKIQFMSLSKGSLYNIG